VGTPLDRRSFLARSAALAAGAAAAGTVGDLAFSGSAWAGRTNGRGRNGVSTAKPKTGGSLIFGTDTDEDGFLPTTAQWDEVGVMYARTVYDPLMIITATGGLAPYLAQSVTSNTDATSWTVTLRPNVKFHDGSPCNGAALLANFEAQAAALLTGPVIKPILSNFTQTGPLTVVANFKEPWVAFPYFLTGSIGGQIAYPVALSYLHNPSSTPTGTGPFIYESWIPQDHFTAKRNPNYWRKGLPYLDSITYKPIADADSRSEALQSGSIDIMVNDTPQITTLYRGNSKWSYIDDSGPVVGEPDISCLLVNTAAPPFNNRDLRLAVAKSIDNAAYSRIIDLGINAPATGPFVPGTPYYSPTGYPGYDLSAAKSLVKTVEKDTGKAVSFTLAGTGDTYTVRAAQYLQSRLQDAGMKVSLATFEQSELISNAITGKYELYQWRQFGAVEPDLNYIFWSTTTNGPEGGLAINMARNDDPTLQQALTTGREATNTSTRYKAYQEVAKRFATDLPYIWLDRATWTIIAYPKVQNFANPTTPSGQKAYPMIVGSIWPTQIWLS
jgi:peptide/nickel transport system substrate-binding protein